MNKAAKVILIAAIAVLASLAIHWALTAKYADWVSTDGIITDVRFYHSSIKHRIDHHSFEIYYTYTVDGQTYSGVSAYSGKETDTDAAAGQAVTVWYDPDDHAESSFHKPWSALEPFVPLLIGAYLISRTLRDQNQTKKGRKYRVHAE